MSKVHDEIASFANDVSPMDAWSTLAGLKGIRERYAAQLDGWRAPVAYAVAHGEDFPHVNEPGGSHGLPAVMLAYVLKHDGSTATFDLEPTQLAEAVQLLEPAEACTEVDHPNLAAWRRVLAEHAGRPIRAVFVGSLDDEVSSPTDALLRDLL